MIADFLRKYAKQLGWVVLPVLLALAGCGKQPPRAAEFPAPAVNGDEVAFATSSPQLESIAVEPARPRTVAIKHLTGRLYWDDDVTVRIFTPVAGRAMKVLADLGQAVTNNAPLLEIDSPDYGQALSAARTAVANLDAADKANARAQDVFTHGGIAQKDVEAAAAAYYAALAERDRAEAVLANYGGSDRGTNEFYWLRTPLAGVVVDKNINPGQELRADMMLGNVPQIFNSLFTVSDPTKLWLQLDVPETDLSALAPGQKVAVHSPARPLPAPSSALATLWTPPPAPSKSAAWSPTPTAASRRKCT
jgi:cobalt-zinc-cadmium efflux system membrane fusion protein